MIKSSILSISILENKNKKFDTVLGLCLNNGLISYRSSRLFAVWAYRDALKWIKNPHPSSINAVNVAERYALNQATDQELNDAEYAAREVVSLATSIDWGSTMGAAYCASRNAFEAAIRSSLSSARTMAENNWDSSEDEQREALIRIINEEILYENTY